MRQTVSRLAAAFMRWRADAGGSALAEYSLILGCIAALAVTALRFEILNAGFVAVADTLVSGRRTVGAQGPALPAPVFAANALGFAGERVPPLVFQMVTVILAVIAGGLVVRRLVGPGRRLAHTRGELASPAGPHPTQQADASRARFVTKRQDILRTLSIDLRRLLPNDLEVRHLMTAQVATSLPSASASELVVKTRQLEIRHLLICAPDGQLLGVVSDRDLHDVEGMTAGDLMTQNMITVTRRTLVRTAITLMLDNHVSSLPVVEEGKLVGILTTTDMVMALQCAMQLVEQLVKDALVGQTAMLAPAQSTSICRRSAAESDPIYKFQQL